MQQYKISEATYKKFRKRWMTFGVPLTVGIIAVCVAISIYSHPGEDNLSTLPYVVPFLVIVFTWSIIRGLKRQKRLLMSYSITISDSEITREQFNTPPLTINFMEIKEILKSKKGGFMVKGRTRTDIIYISHLIDNAASLEEELGKFAPITTSVQESRKRVLILALIILSLAAFLTLCLTDNKIIAVISGMAVITLFTLRFIELVTNKSIPTSLKRRSWTYLLVVAFVIYLVYTKLTAV